MTFEQVHNWFLGITFDQVKEGLKQGKKYRRKCWREDNYMVAIGRSELFIIDSRDRLCLEDFDADDWEEVK